MLYKRAQWILTVKYRSFTINPSTPGACTTKATAYGEPHVPGNLAGSVTMTDFHGGPPLVHPLCLDATDRGTPLVVDNRARRHPLLGEAAEAEVALVSVSPRAVLPARAKKTSSLGPQVAAIQPREEERLPASCGCGSFSMAGSRQTSTPLLRRLPITRYGEFSMGAPGRCREPSALAPPRCSCSEECVRS